MPNDLSTHLDIALAEYTSGPHLETLLEAKKEYFAVTGTVSEDDLEFESRMSCFNNWYVFNYHSNRGRNTVIQDYLEKKHIDDEISNAFLEVNYSLFEFKKLNFRKQLVIEDYLHKTKIQLAKDHDQIGIIPQDIFIGRVITFKDQNYLLKGICMLPREIRSILKKESKKINKFKDSSKEIEFLLKLENLKIKWTRYGHIQTEHIFRFN